jgi:hypothetical protein
VHWQRLVRVNVATTIAMTRQLGSGTIRLFVVLLYRVCCCGASLVLLGSIANPVIHPDPSSDLGPDWPPLPLTLQENPPSTS